jgi:hypothetical protein
MNLTCSSKRGTKSDDCLHFNHAWFSCLFFCLVDCFVNSNLVGKVVDEAIAIGAKAVWLQLDVIDLDAVDRAKAAGLLTVMDRCPAIEYQKHG